MIFRPACVFLCAAVLSALPFATWANDPNCDASQLSTAAHVSACNTAPSFDDIFRRKMEDAGIPGGAWAIVRDGHITESGAFGVRRLGDPAPVGTDTVFRIASLSKTFAAQIGAQLESEGKLRWDTPVTDHAPGFRLKQAGQAERLHLSHLLGQSTGIVPNAYDNLLEDDVPLARILPQFARLEPVCRLGDCYTYQNILFSLVEPAYVQATGQDYASLLHERLFQPLKMDNTSVGLDAFKAAQDRADPHVRRNGVWQMVSVAPGYYQVAPAAGINASVNDMARWLLAQMGSHPEVITPEQVATVTRKRIATPRELRRHGWKDLLSDAHYGLGWRIYNAGGHEIVMHSGWVQGFVADIGYSADRRVGLVVLLNGESRSINELTTSFWLRELGIPSRASDSD